MSFDNKNPFPPDHVMQENLLGDAIPKKSIHTVVTACDEKFVWGAMLLGLSMRYHQMNCAYNVLGYDLPQEMINCLESIPGTKVFPTHKTDTRSVCTQKPLAINTADTEIIVWMDADCVVSGNLEKFFVCPDNRMQIRLRGKPENFSVYRNFYGKHDPWGQIPNKVLDLWRSDVNDLRESRIQTVFQTNCFVLNRQHLPFIELWKTQMLKVIPPDTKGVYSKTSVAYSMTDESVINSLFAFSAQAPQTAEYMMDKEANAACIHFGLSPKPWQHWTLTAMNHYEYIQTLIAWGQNMGILLPQITASLLSSNRRRERNLAILRDSLKALRFKASSTVRNILRHL